MEYLSLKQETMRSQIKALPCIVLKVKVREMNTIFVKKDFLKKKKLLMEHEEMQESHCKEVYFFLFFVTWNVTVKRTLLKAL